MEIHIVIELLPSCLHACLPMCVCVYVYVCFIIMQHIEYRQKYGADTILHDYTPPELFTECLAGGFFGEDLEGHPVWYENLGNADIRGKYVQRSLHCKSK